MLHLFRAGPTTYVLFELVPELCNIGLDRPSRRVREDTNCLAFHVAGDREQLVQVLETSPPVDDAAQNSMNPAGPLTAG